jgi:succinate-acetate transporter protein
MESIGLYKLAGFRGVSSTASGKYYDRNAWKSLGGFWLMICLLGMLLGPLWALPFVIDRAVRLAVVTAFAVVFSLIVIVGTTFKASHRGVLVAG